MVAEFIGGPNEGSRLQSRFYEQSATCTRVVVEAWLVLTPMRRLFAPLVRAALRHTIAKGLREDRYDLEIRGYRPAPREVPALCP